MIDDSRRTLPDFLGVGTPKSGSTWIHGLLSGHSAVWMPRYRKELHYFDRYYDRGVAWYAGFFPKRSATNQYVTVGEITPTYMYHREALSRIRKLGTVKKVIAILRQPTDRAYSMFLHRIRLDGAKRVGSFREFIQGNVEGSLEEGQYAQYLGPYLETFGIEHVLVLIFERAIADVEATKEKLARFLGIPQEGFAPSAGRKPMNAAFAPAFPTVTRAVYAVDHALRARDLNWVVEFGKKLGLRRVLSSNRRVLPKISPEDKAFADDYFEPHIAELEDMLGTGITEWHGDPRR